MKELSTQEIREIELNILKKFDSFCKENSIQYYLSNGTLLGAVKYQGFIPWDDDVDVLVPRKDYDRLLDIYRDDEKYCLFAHEKYPKYLYPFAKLCDISTLKEEANLNNGVTLGIDIDIFPLDYWNSDFAVAQKEVKHIQKNMFYLGLTKLHKADSLNPIKRVIKRFVMTIVKIRGSKYYVRKIITASKVGKKGGYVGCKSWCIYGESEIIPAEVFNNNIQVEFEGQFFTAPSGYEIYLRNLYGEYKLDPPIDRQKTHHSFPEGFCFYPTIRHKPAPHRQIRKAM